MPLADAGVLTLYSAAGREVSLSQRRAIESILPAIGHSLAAVATNRAQIIDCTAEPTRIAALTVLDSLLSHRPSGQSPDIDSALMLVSLYTIRDDIRDPIPTPVAADLGLLIKALTQPRMQRYFLRLSRSQLLVYSHAPGARSALAAALDNAHAATARYAATVETSWIESPQALQETARRIYNTRESGGHSSHERKVH
jgi:hypothetical protein